MQLYEIFNFKFNKKPPRHVAKGAKTLNYEI